MNTNTYIIQVRPGSSDSFQFYEEEVTASTRDDAVKKIERANPGCNVTCMGSVYSSNDESSLNGVGGTATLISIFFGIWLIFVFSPWVLMVGGGAAGVWLGEKVTGKNINEMCNDIERGSNSKAGAILLILMMLGGGFGFVKGNQIHEIFMGNNDIPAQIQQ